MGKYAYTFVIVILSTETLLMDFIMAMVIESWITKIRNSLLLLILPLSLLLPKVEKIVFVQSDDRKYMEGII